MHQVPDVAVSHLKAASYKYIQVECGISVIIGMRTLWLLCRRYVHL